VLASTELCRIYYILLIKYCWLLINWQFWRKNANHHEKSIFTTVPHGMFSRFRHNIIIPQYTARRRRRKKFVHTGCVALCYGARHTKTWRIAMQQRMRCERTFGYTDKLGAYSVLLLPLSESPTGTLNWRRKSPEVEALLYIRVARTRCTCKYRPTRIFRLQKEHSLRLSLCST